MLQANKDLVDIDNSKILIVDDQKDNIVILRNVLQGQGFSISFATSGRDALELCVKNAPDLILLDMNMPGMDGVLTCELIKRDEQLSSIPIIFVTANQDVSALVKAFDAGASDYITKPIREEEVLARIRTHLLMSAYQKALSKANQKLESLAKVDQLTGVENRRAFEDRISNEWQRSRRDHTPLGLMMIDVDFFKPFNDFYGHPAGDACLSAIAQAMRLSLRRVSDAVARYGGEEFVIVLPNTDLKGTLNVAKVVCHAVESLHIEHKKSQVSSYVTASIGCSSIIAHDGGCYKELIAAADVALYAAKDGGRNRACHHLPESNA